ncbi:hypothetical protein ACP4OV_028258 [Aristida adscensionis]
MENVEGWDDVNASVVALRRRLAAQEEEAPGKAMEMDRPEPQVDPVEDDDDDFEWDPLDLELNQRLSRASKAAKEKPVSAAERERLAAERKAAWEKWQEQEMAEARAWEEKIGGDYEAWVASRFRDEWNTLYSRRHGPFDAVTEVEPMRFTYKPAPFPLANFGHTLQIFSVKVAGIRGGLQWPIDVFGLVAARDSVDQRRNIIFNRERENCQSLTEEDPYLVLTGPSRAVVVVDPVTIEVKLQVKGTSESEDQDFSFLAVTVVTNAMCSSELINIAHTSKLSTLKFSIGYLMGSLEATVSVQVVEGGWPDGFRCQIATFATSDSDNKTASTDHKKFVLLDSRNEKVPFNDDGSSKLSRRVACVESYGKTFKVSVKATQVVKNAVEEEAALTPKEGEEDIFMPKEVEREGDFTPKKADISEAVLDMDFCKMKVTVARSLLTPHAYY